jgi:dihydroflavonol-4-reductase
MKALVTGANGFLGSQLVAALEREELELRAMARKCPGSGTSRVEWVAGDLCDVESLKRALSGCKILFHAAAHYTLWAPDPQIFWRVNVQGTDDLLRLALEVGVEKIVYTSSVSCIGHGPRGEAANEDREPATSDLCGPYKITKYEAEKVARRYAAEGAPIVIVNPASIIGPGDLKPTPTGKIILDFLNGKMPATVETGLNFVDVRDVAAGHVLAWKKGEAGRRYILGHREQNLSLSEFLKRLAALTGLTPPRFKIPHAVAYAVGWASTRWSDWVTGREPAVALDGVRMARHMMFFDPSRAVRELGLPQTPLEETLRDAARDFAARGALNPARAEQVLRALDE